MASASKCIDLLLLAFGMQASAACLQTVTLTSGNYASTLMVGLLLTIGADALLALVMPRGGRGFRLAAIVLMLPTVLFVADFVRRAGAVFP